MIQDHPDLTTLRSALEAYDTAWAEFASALAKPETDKPRLTKARDRICAIRKALHIYTIEEE